MMPRPPKYPVHEEVLRQNEEIRRLRNSTIPGVQRRASEHSIEVSSELQAMARAVLGAQGEARRNHEQLVAQVAAMHAHQIEMHAYVARHPWMRSPAARIVATVVGSLVGAYVATKGFAP